MNQIDRIERTAPLPKIDPFDVIERYALGYHLGVAVECLLHRDRLDDLRKAERHLKRWLEQDWPFLPVARDGVLNWADPSTIAASFDLRLTESMALAGILRAALPGDIGARLLIEGALGDVQTAILIADGSAQPRPLDDGGDVPMRAVPGGRLEALLDFCAARSNGFHAVDDVGGGP